MDISILTTSVVIAALATSLHAEEPGQISHVENVPAGSRVLVCDDDFSLVDEFIPPSLPERDDLKSSDTPDQDSPFDLVIMSHRSAIGKSDCKALTQEENALVHSKYEKISYLRTAAAHQIPELAAALRRAYCQPLYGMRVAKHKTVSIVLFERESETVEDTMLCAKRILEVIKTGDGR
jgi:hypothetical protein